MNFVKNYHKYGPNANSYDLLKTIAILLMLIDHIGCYFFPDESMYRAIGRWCVPIWLFFAGYSRPRKIIDYQLLSWGGVLVLVDLIVGGDLLPINILLTIFCSRLFILWVEKQDKMNLLYLLLYTFIMLLFYPTALLFEYGTVSFLFALLGYLHQTGQHHLKYIYGVVTLTLFIAAQYLDFDFTLIETLVMAIGVVATTLLMMHFPRPIIHIHRDNFVSKTIKYVGRNTLYIYVIHVALFVILSTMLGIEPKED